MNKKKERCFLIQIKVLNEKPTANIIFQDERLNAIPLSLRLRQGCPFSPLLTNTILEILAIKKKNYQN